MAKKRGVWGIDIGNASLKALRCSSGESADEVVAEAFDFIEYPQILTQPGVEPAELIADALKQFLSRNDLRGDRVAVSVPGQNGLLRFFKLPPVEKSKIPAIVEYEARQQIPFAPEEVVRASQPIGAGSEDEGFALEMEIALWAMKRDQVFKALEPFTKAGIEVDIIQLAPLALCNFLKFDQMTDMVDAEDYDPDNPPPATVILSLGTDATDMVMTDGYRVHQRNIPLGGSQFTKALTKDLKLTFAKAEHLKRNAQAAEDPKALFQAMRPVFNDLLTEIQRSVGYFTSVDRNAKIGRVVTLGNAMKLPGLRRYLEQSLGLEVTRADTFTKLVGSEVVDAPAFKENQLSFGVCYGLALQGLSKSWFREDLLPKELRTDRIVRRKKPWAVATVALLLLGCLINYTSHSRALSTVDASIYGSAESKVSSVTGRSKQLQTEAATAAALIESAREIGANVTSNVEGRIRWLELLRAINSCLPGDPPDERPEDIMDCKELYLDNLECQKVNELELAFWIEKMKEKGWYQSRNAPAAVDPATGEAPVEATAEAAPAEPGWIVQLSGVHYHNKRESQAYGADYVLKTLIGSLEGGQVKLPDPDDPDDPDKGEWVRMKELGISTPSLINPGRIETVLIANPKASSAIAGSGGYARTSFGGGDDDDDDDDDDGDYDDDGSSGGISGTAVPEIEEPAEIEVDRFRFTVQFCWVPKTPSQRKTEREAREAAEAEPLATEEVISP